MRVVQLGCGITGLVCAELLATHPEIDNLVLADAAMDGAERLAEKLESDKITIRRTDAGDDADLRSVVRGSDVVVCSLPWDLNGKVMETAADEGVDYVDFCLTKEAMDDFDKVDGMCRDAGITAITAVGLEPGISNALAGYAASKLDSVNEVHVIDGDNGVIEGHDFASTWSPVDWIDEVCVPAAVFRDGKIEYVPPLNEREVYDFPEPIGPLPVYKTLHDETFLISKHIKGVKHVDFRIGIDDNFASMARTLRKLGLHSKELVDVKGVKMRPLDLLASLMPRPVDIAGKLKGHGGTVVEVIGEKDSRPTRVKAWAFASHEESYEKYHTNATGFLVGVGGAIPTEMLVEGLVKEKGLIAPDQLPAGEFVRRLGQKGLEVKEEIARL
jgi:saccharopine dehydrogenase (NAD+, L-lysine-forming)